MTGGSLKLLLVKMLLMLTPTKMPIYALISLGSCPGPRRI